MVTVVPDACQFDPDHVRGTVVLESDLPGPPFNAAIDELTTMAARTAALQYAQSKGVVPACQNGNVIQPYAVNVDGVLLDEVRDPQGKPYPANHPKVQPAKYRAEVPVARKFT